MVKNSYFKKGYISQAKWSQLSEDCLQIDYQPITHIKVIKVSKDRETGDLTKDMVAAICET